MAIERKKLEAVLPLAPIKKEGGFEYGGFVPAMITDIRVEYTDYEKGEFAGQKVPGLVFEFKNYKASVDEPDKRMLHWEKPVQCLSGENLTPMASEDVEKLTQQQVDRICHIFDVLGERIKRSIDDMPKIIELINTLPLSGNAKTRLEHYNTLYMLLVAFANGNVGDTQLQPIHRTKEGTAVPVWLKLVTNYAKNDPKRDGKFFVFPTFITKGNHFIELLIIANNKLLPPRNLTIKPSDKLTVTSSGSFKPGASSDLPPGQAPQTPGGGLNALLAGLGGNVPF